ncbi:programmed cell death 5 [Homo sapiens]|uniref:Programmed cell death 5 n=2 Tax=Hominidae TaxID=9604 RepID=X6R2P6_HUMAN|nr:programmed cell death 5 [Homo sapiens]KAI4041804.1 programmed cell death 5 [Homo sapiens]PNJ09255.1 PDCD5 isoform 4 [Pongo abelii]
MADEELEALRRQRLAELQAKHGDPGDAAQQEAKHSRNEKQYLSPSSGSVGPGQVK